MAEPCSVLFFFFSNLHYLLEVTRKKTHQAVGITASEAVLDCVTWSKVYGQPRITIVHVIPDAEMQQLIELMTNYWLMLALLPTFSYSSIPYGNFF